MFHASAALPPGEQLRYRRLSGLQSRPGNFEIQLNFFRPAAVSIPDRPVRSYHYTDFVTDVVIKSEVPDTASAVSQVLQNQPATDALNKEHTSISGTFIL